MLRRLKHRPGPPVTPTALSRLRFAPLAIVLASAALWAANPGNTFEAPVPAPLLAAQKAFISNAGVDNTSLTVFKREGDVNQPYNRFYAANERVGQVQLMNAPPIQT